MFICLGCISCFIIRWLLCISTSFWVLLTPEASSQMHIGATAYWQLVTLTCHNKCSSHNMSIIWLIATYNTLLTNCSIRCNCLILKSPLNTFFFFFFLSLLRDTWVCLHVRHNKWLKIGQPVEAPRKRCTEKTEQKRGN